MMDMDVFWAEDRVSGDNMRLLEGINNKKERIVFMLTCDKDGNRELHFSFKQNEIEELKDLSSQLKTIISELETRHKKLN